MKSTSVNQKIVLSWRAKVLMLAMSVFFGLLLGEVLLRVYVGITTHTLSETAAKKKKPNGENFSLGDIVEVSPNPRLIYDLAPNMKGRFGAAEYRSNSFGMRGAEVALAKPKNVFRIATLGDSSMFGWRVSDDQPYVRVLERILNSAGDSTHYEVLNFSVPGYNTAIEAETYIAKVQQFQPDLIILQFDINDLTLPTFVVDDTKWWSMDRCLIWNFAQGALNSEAIRSKLLGIDGTRLKEAARRQGITKSGKVADFIEYQANLTPKKFRYMVDWAGVLTAINKLWQASSQPILHLSMPSPADKALEYLGRPNDHDRFSEYVKKKSQSNSRLHYLDISAAGMDFAKAEKADLYKDFVIEYPGDAHPSPERHILIARDIYLYLVQHEMLPKGSLHYLYCDELAEQMWEQTSAQWHSRKGK